MNKIVENSNKINKFKYLSLLTDEDLDNFATKGRIYWIQGSDYSWIKLNKSSIDKYSKNKVKLGNEFEGIYFKITSKGIDYRTLLHLSEFSFYTLDGFGRYYSINKDTGIIKYFYLGITQEKELIAMKDFITSVGAEFIQPDSPLYNGLDCQLNKHKKSHCPGLTSKCIFGSDLDKELKRKSNESFSDWCARLIKIKEDAKAAKIESERIKNASEEVVIEIPEPVAEPTPEIVHEIIYKAPEIDEDKLKSYVKEAVKEAVKETQLEAKVESRSEDDSNNYQEDPLSKSWPTPKDPMANLIVSSILEDASRNNFKDYYLPSNKPSSRKDSFDIGSELKTEFKNASVLFGNSLKKGVQIAKNLMYPKSQLSKRGSISPPDTEKLSSVLSNFTPYEPSKKLEKVAVKPEPILLPEDKPVKPIDTRSYEEKRNSIIQKHIDYMKYKRASIASCSSVGYEDTHEFKRQNSMNENRPRNVSFSRNNPLRHTYNCDVIRQYKKPSFKVMPSIQYPKIDTSYNRNDFIKTPKIKYDYTGKNFSSSNEHKGPFLNSYGNPDIQKYDSSYDSNFGSYDEPSKPKVDYLGVDNQTRKGNVEESLIKKVEEEIIQKHESDQKKSDKNYNFYIKPFSPSTSSSKIEFKSFKAPITKTSSQESDDLPPPPEIKQTKINCYDDSIDLLNSKPVPVIELVPEPQPEPIYETMASLELEIKPKPNSFAESIKIQSDTLRRNRMKRFLESSNSVEEESMLNDAGLKKTEIPEKESIKPKVYEITNGDKLNAFIEKQALANSKYFEELIYCMEERKERIENENFKITV